MERWLANHVFVHGDVEFLPRVTGIGEWVVGYLGAAGELGDKIDWFDKKPEAEQKQDKKEDRSNDSAAASGVAEEEVELSEDTDGTDEQGPLVPLIEENDEELRWGVPFASHSAADQVDLHLEFDDYPRKPFPNQVEAIISTECNALRYYTPNITPENQGVTRFS